MRWVKITLCFVLVFVIGFVAGSRLATFGGTIPAVSMPESRSMQSCEQDTLTLTKPAPLDAAAINAIIDACRNEIQNQGSVNDFELRRLAFLSRYYADRITLWMVVIITFSGVVLAALQLMASYQLALIHGTQMASDSDMTVEQGKLVFRSSITGLFVLIISFAFFLTYVLYIYTMPVVNVDATQQTAPGGGAAPTLSPGGLGKLPPGAAPHQPPG
jgi:hypothetical protein